MRTTSTLPIVMTYGTEPVANGFVARLARPGGNITGLTADVMPETWGIRLQFLKEISPKISRVAVLWNPDVAGVVKSWQVTEEAAKRLGVTLRSHQAHRPDDLDTAFSSIGKEATSIHSPT